MHSNIFYLGKKPLWYQREKDFIDGLHIMVLCFIFLYACKYILKYQVDANMCPKWFQINESKT